MSHGHQPPDDPFFSLPPHLSPGAESDDKSASPPVASTAAATAAAIADTAAAAETAALARILHALSLYAPPALAEVDRWERAAAALAPAHAAVLGRSLLAKHAAGRAAVSANTAFLGDLVRAVVDGECGLGPGLAPHLAAASAAAGAAVSAGVRPAPADIEKVRYLLRNAARDWSAAGAGERAACYGRLVAALVEELKPPPPAAAAAAAAGGGEARPPAPRPRILVPGAGLARLAVDLAAGGFCVEANEHSFYMLLGSAYLLNAGPTTAAPAAVHPWALSPSNRVSYAHQFRAVAIPDADAGALAAGGGPGGLAMVAGEFTAVYGRKEAGGPHQQPPPTFDGVATAFFLDCAPNALAFIDTIAGCLRPGGLWVNCGPLLWHWEAGEGGGGAGGVWGAADDVGDDGDHAPHPAPAAAATAAAWPHSLELSLEDVLAAAGAAGFDLVRPVEMVAGVPFNEDSGSMVVTTYTAAFWVMRKRG